MTTEIAIEVPSRLEPVPGVAQPKPKVRKILDTTPSGAQPHPVTSQGLRPATPPAHHRPRFRALALVGRWPPEHMGGLGHSDVRKTGQKVTSAVRKRELSACAVTAALTTRRRAGKWLSEHAIY